MLSQISCYARFKHFFCSVYGDFFIIYLLHFEQKRKSIKHPTLIYHLLTRKTVMASSLVLELRVSQIQKYISTKNLEEI